MRSSDARNAWRRDCSTSPIRESTRTSARSRSTHSAGGPIGEEHEVRVVGPHRLARPLDRLELVLEDRFRVVEQPTGERRLPIVDRPRSGKPKQFSHLEIAHTFAIFHGGIRDL